MSDQPAIEVNGLKKRFRREIISRDYVTWKTLLVKPFASKKAKDFITVLDGIDFSIMPGKTLAIIGQNGSGKSTLLKMLAGIYKPDHGEIKVNGRVSSLIELGAGFHPEFTGRENVFLNGTILGLSKKEITKRFDHIAAYSGLGDYIDAPVRTYSSGMYVRLGFSVAVNVNPDVLLVDEVLAVGDEAFAHKCEDKINEFRRRDKTICLVTHDMGAVEKFADEVLWLDGGKVAARGNPRRVIDAYRQKVAAEEDAIRRDEAEQNEADLSGKRWGDGDVVIDQIRLVDNTGAKKAIITSGESMVLELDYHQKKPTNDLVFGVGIFNAQEVQCYGTNTHLERLDLTDLPTKGRVRFKVDQLDMVQGTYFIDVACHARDGRAYDYIKRALSFSVRSVIHDVGVYRPSHNWEILPL